MVFMPVHFWMFLSHVVHLLLILQCPSILPFKSSLGISLFLQCDLYNISSLVTCSIWVHFWSFFYEAMKLSRNSASLNSLGTPAIKCFRIDFVESPLELPLIAHDYSIFIKSCLFMFVLPLEKKKSKRLDPVKRMILQECEYADFKQYHVSIMMEDSQLNNSNFFNFHITHQMVLSLKWHFHTARP